MRHGIILPDFAHDLTGMRRLPPRPYRRMPLLPHAEFMVRTAFDSEIRRRPLIPAHEVPLARLAGLPATVDELRAHWRATGTWPEAPHDPVD